MSYDWNGEAKMPKILLDLDSGGLEMGYHSQLQPAGKYENERSIYYVSHKHEKKTCK